MKYYICGPMTNIPQFNVPLFTEAAAKLRSQGFEIVSPHEMDGAAVQKASLQSTDGKHNGTIGGESYWGMLSKDVLRIATEIDGLILLPGWMTSTGAKMEVYTALLSNKTFQLYCKADGSIGPVISREYIKNTLIGNT